MPPNYGKAVAYFISSLLVGTLNDAITKYLLAQSLPIAQVAFCRLLIGTLLLAIYGLFTRKITAPTQPLQHLLRGFLFVIATTLWTYSLQYLQLSLATTISFTIPLFVLLLSPLLLKEKVPRYLWLPTLTGMLGILFILKPNFTQLNLHYPTGALLISVVLFAFLDILNKKYTTTQPIFQMVFYANIVSTCLICPIAYYQWSPLQGLQPCYLLALGIGGTLIIYALLHAYQQSPIAYLAPLRYLELLFSLGIGYLFFQELPPHNTLWGALIIIPSMLFIVAIPYFQQARASSKQEAPTSPPK